MKGYGILGLIFLVAVVAFIGLSFRAGAQVDSDGDGISDSNELAWGYDPYDACSPFDQTDDREINILDLLLYKPEFGGSNPNFDINCDGTVNVLDLLLYKPALGAPCSPG